jgi:2-desacetyl-2-hydroxyethyl bacteriochlorophyllide A dehydrogenase
MRAAHVPGPGRIAVVEVPRPDPAPGEVLVRVRACGVCGSDLHWWHGQMPAPPACPGHEIAGEVAGVGAGVTSLREGDRVALEGIVACGACARCAGGDYHLCRRVRILGMQLAGGFADYLALPARHCFRVPDGIEAPTAALSEPLAVAVHAVRLARLEIGQRVLVLGAGTIGLAAVVAARAGGAGEILVTARRPQQRAAALALGADRVLDDHDAAALRTAARAAPVDVVIETVGGTADTLETGVAACAPGGTVVVLGVFTTPPPLPALALVGREIRLVGSFVYNRPGARADFEIVQDILARQGAALAGALCTHRVPLDRIADAFATAADKASGAIKVTVVPTEDGAWASRG